MVRRCRFSKLINKLVILSVSCSVLLILWSLILDNLVKKNNKHTEESNGVTIKNDNQDKNVLKFQTTFHFSDPLEKDDKLTYDQVNLLTKELQYTQEIVNELKNAKFLKNDCKTFQLPDCQVIHIAIICAGYKETKRVVTLIKSILFYRRHPLHFHFISDISGRHVLQVLFKTWMLKQVGVSFYDAEKLKADVDWIPNTHYSGVYGLMKLTLTRALPEFLSKVIVLDTDVFFLTDLAELWAFFNNFTEDQAIGLVENQSQWYTGKLWKKYKIWPAIGRGFNTGVMLFDLQKLRKFQWANLWRMTAEKQLLNLFSTVLADQDVINAALKDNPQIVYKLPCQWNIQLSDNTESEYCYNELIELKAIHWNSPNKHTGNKLKHVEYFRNMYLTFLEYNGNLLRKSIFSCLIPGENATETSREKKLSDNDQCYDIKIEQSTTRRVHLYYMDYDYKPEVGDVTLMTHLSMDRIQILDLLSQHWEGPMSISLYASDAEAQQFTRYSSVSSFLRKRKNIGLHIVYKDGDLYPVNYLRNVALEHVQTTYVFLSDIDFLPMIGLYNYLRGLANITNMEKKAVVVPAFETYQYKLDYPLSKKQLIEYWGSQKVDTFRGEVWQQGHAATDFQRWKTSSTDYEVRWEVDFEPYILVKKSSVPLYDMRFVGFGWNKVSHIMELHALRFKFVVAANGFIVHMPHAPSVDITKYRSSSLYRRCLGLLKKEFQYELERKYNIEFQ
ncbi:xylosyl- and glucuronyltransferase LARGE2s isoform X2 [Hydra vulgaris]|uniref:Xylosyl- and glucuronyltransferase LARGE2s isoform X2 n=1 Tax=Hydra vulgaris TaxID=6087 RepID=A0ABM4BE44_HYDVU